MEVKFTFAVSKTIAAIICAAGVVAVHGIMFIITAPVAMRFVAAISLIVLLVSALRSHALLQGNYAVRRVGFLPDGNIEIITNNGVWQGQLQTATITPLLTIFVVRGRQKTFNILAAFDSMPPNTHRQLRVCLQNAYVSPEQQKQKFFTKRKKT